MNHWQKFKLMQKLILNIDTTKCSSYLDCKDSDAFADQCPTLATYEGYCKYHHEWTKKYCAKSCGWCCKYIIDEIHALS